MSMYAQGELVIYIFYEIIALYFCTCERLQLKLIETVDERFIARIWIHLFSPEENWCCAMPIFCCVYVVTLQRINQGICSNRRDCALYYVLCFLYIFKRLRKF